MSRPRRDDPKMPVVELPPGWVVDDDGIGPQQHVYLIGGASERRGRRRCKIGMAFDPSRRLRELQTASPDRLALLATGPGGPRLEAELHVRYRRHRLHGEWFSLGAKEQQEIITVLGRRTAENEDRRRRYVADLYEQPRQPGLVRRATRATWKALSGLADGEPWPGSTPPPPSERR